jgi:hypothetical protein
MINICLECERLCRVRNKEKGVYVLNCNAYVKPFKELKILSGYFREE